MRGRAGVRAKGGKGERRKRERERENVGEREQAREIR